MVHLVDRSSGRSVSWAIRHRPSHVKNWFLREGCACCRGEHNGGIQMNLARTITHIIIVLWSCTAWSATLTWNASSESDLAGYRVYQCSLLPCTRASGNASSLASLGLVTDFNIGTPLVTQYYFLTAYDSANNESRESNLATYTPAGSPPPPPAPIGLHFTAAQ